MKVTRTSPLTGKVVTQDIEGLTQEMIENWKNGALIQDALHGISPEDREFIMTGISKDEWDAMYPAEEEDEEYDSQNYNDDWGGF